MSSRRPAVLHLGVSIGVMVLAAWVVARLLEGGSRATPGGAAAFLGEERGSPVIESGTRSADAPSAPGRRVTSGDGPLSVRVTDSGGLPVEGVSVALCDEGRTEGERARAPSGRTDASGSVSFDRRSASAERFVLVGEGLAPWMVPVTGMPVQEIELPEPCLTGRLVRADPPGLERLRLLLADYVDPSQAWCPDARAFLTEQGRQDPSIDVPVARDGSFRVTGIAAGRAVLHLRGPYRFDTPGLDDSMSVRLPARDLVLAVVRPPGLTAVPLAPHPMLKGAPLVVRGRFGIATGRASEEVVLSAREGEPFTLLDPRGASESLELEVLDGTGSTVLARRRLEGAREVHADLGALPLDLLATLRFRVTDATGLQVAGARVVTLGRASRPTDAQGRTEAAVVPGGEVLVGAPGHDVARVELPARLLDELSVELQDATCLEVVVAGADDERDQPIVGVSLPSSWIPAQSLVSGLRGPSPVAWESDGAGVELLFRAAGGRLRLAGLGTRNPGDEEEDLRRMREDRVRVTLMDRYGQELETRESPMEHGGTVTMRFELTAAWTLVGRVVDANGDAVAGASVVVGSADLDDDQPPTDPFGRFERRGVRAAQPSISIRAPGYVDRSERGQGPSWTHELALDRARRLWLEVTGPDGERKDVRLVLRHLRGIHGGVSRGRGLFELGGVPATGLVAQIDLSDGARLELPVPDDVEHAVLVVR